MKTLRQIHLYLGCLFAPLLIYFSLSGAWQLYRFNDLPKTGEVPMMRSILHELSNPHTHSTLPGASPKLSTSAAFNWFSVLMALGIVATAVMGIVLAFRFSKSPRTVGLYLGAGALVPVILLWLSRAG